MKDLGPTDPMGSAASLFDRCHRYRGEGEGEKTRRDCSRWYLLPDLPNPPGPKVKKKKKSMKEKNTIQNYIL